MIATPPRLSVSPSLRVPASAVWFVPDPRARRLRDPSVVTSPDEGLNAGRQAHEQIVDVGLPIGDDREPEGSVPSGCTAQVGYGEPPVGRLGRLDPPVGLLLLDRQALVAALMLGRGTGRPGPSLQVRDAERRLGAGVQHERRVQQPAHTLPVGDDAQP